MNIQADNVVYELKNHNEHALHFIIEQYGGLLQSIITKHLFPYSEEVDECLDDTLLAIWQNGEFFDEAKGSFKNWIAVIAKYKALDRRKKLQRYNERYISTLEFEESFTNTERTELEDVEELLQHLSVEDQLLFKKYYLDNINSKNIAEELDVSVPVIHNRLSRGRHKLRALKQKWITGRL